MNKKKKNDNSKNKLFIYIVVMFIDVGLVIYCARRNILNYVKLNGEEIILSGDKKKYFGSNNITLVISLFVYIYLCMLNKFIFKEKKKLMYYVVLALFLLLINILLFFVFSRKIY